MNILLEVIYYLLFLCFGIIIVISRDTLASKLVESQKMVDFLFKKSIINDANEFIYAKRLIVGIGLVLVAFGFFKALESVIGFSQ